MTLHQTTHHCMSVVVSVAVTVRNTSVLLSQALKHTTQTYTQPEHIVSTKQYFYNYLGVRVTIH